MSLYGTVSFILGAVAYGVVAVVLMLGRPGGERAGWMIGAATVTVLWGIGAATISFSGDATLTLVASLDTLHSFIWTVAILSFLAPRERGAKNLVRRGLVVGAAVAGLSTMVVASVTPAGTYLGMVVLSVIGLLSVEQVYRNSSGPQRDAFRLVCVAIGGVFVANLFVYSHAALLGGLVREFWESRGLVAAALAPLIVLGLRNHPAWERGLFVSRHMAFYTASLLGVGVYLLSMAVIAYLLHALGGQWSLVLQLLFLFAALAVLGIVLFSRGLQARLKVFLVKHFYRSKYDYRAEWLRLTELLARAKDSRSLAQAALQGIAGIVGSNNGDLYIARDGRHYDWLLSLVADDAQRPAYTDSHPVVRFLADSGWVIDTEQYARSPDHYDSAFGAPEEAMLPKRALIVPLDCRGHLQGFVVLAKPAQLGDLNFDDHDILKTAGKQVATFFAQALAQEELTETRQFEAMNKLTTFLMHDLKNLIAQQELVVKNAQRFGHRPEFFNDAIETVRSGVERMKNVVGQLRSGAFQSQVTSRVDVSKALIEVRSRCADREPVPVVSREDEPVWVAMDRDRLLSALTHLVRNAQDATPEDGQIAISMSAGNGSVTVEVADTGQGMDAAFVRDHLFRPFDSTKGAAGMGIGVYQVRELVRAAGGDVQVRSTPGAGTTFRLTLPLETERLPPAG